MTDDVIEPGKPGASTGEQEEAPNADHMLAAAADEAETPAREQVLEKERDQFYDLLLRKSAEFDNYRKRTDRERRDQAARATSDLLLEMLPIVDDLERALKADVADAQAGTYRAGVELIYRQMLELLKRHGVTPFDAVGADFAPNVHQAVVTEEAPGKRDGEVLEELRRGYMIGERLLRAAMVKVARA